MEALGYLVITLGIGLMPLAMIVGHELGEQSRRRKGR